MADTGVVTDDEFVVDEGSPASVNLRVPPYAFAGPRKLVIGVDQV